MRAKQIFVDHGVRDALAPAGKRLTDGVLEMLRRTLEVDPLFRRRFDADPVAAAEEAGMPELAAALEQEMRELVALAERVANDNVFRAELEADPVAALAAAGMPEAVAEQLLNALDVPDEVLTRMPEVVAHQQQELPLNAHLLILLLGSTAVTEEIHSATRDA
jgi:putative modified peptide